MGRRRIIGLLLFLSLACFGEGIIGTWKSRNVTYYFYKDKTGAVEDQIEGDSITHWEIKGDKIYYRIEGPWNDLDSMSLKFINNNVILINGYMFKRKI